MSLVLDTCGLIYWTLDPARLTRPARRALDEASHLIVSSILIWEIGLKVQRGKLNIPLSIERYVERLRRVRGLEIVSVDVRTWLAVLALDWTHRDSVDRTVVATAMRHNAGLVTSDRVIRDYYPRVIW